jgi:hypothetical protein
VGSNDLSLSWSQWLLQVQFTFVVGNLCQVLNPSKAMCWESEATLLTNQEGDRWASHC